MKRVMCLGLLILVGALMANASGQSGTSTGPVSIVMWHNNNEAYQASYQETIKWFMAENPNINVSVVLQPTVGYDQKIMAAFVSGNEPDIVDSAHDFVLEIEQKFKAWKNLDDYKVREWEEVKLMDPAVLNTLTYEGKLYAIQFTDQPLGLFVRKSWMQNVGWSQGSPYLQTWDDLMELGKKFTFGDPDKNGKADTWGYEMFGSLDRNYATVQFEYHMNSMGQELLKDGKLNINTDIGVKALAIMQDAVHKDKIAPPDTANYTHVEFYRDVPAGFVGIGRLGGWNVPGWLKALNGDFVVATYPALKKGDKHVAPTIYHTVQLSVNTKKADAALKYVRFLLGKRVQELFYTKFGQSYRPDLDYAKLAPTEQDLFFKREMLPKNTNRIYVIKDSWWTYDARKALAEYIQSALIDGKLAPADVLKKADADITARFKK
jgi:ABC-type glycerol-3-phosphate transport system substrate-binding protein